MKKNYTICLCGRRISFTVVACLCGINCNHNGNFIRHFQDKFLRYANDGRGIEVFSNNQGQIELIFPEKFKYLMLAKEEVIIDCIRKYSILQ